MDGSVRRYQVNLRKSRALSAPVLGVFATGWGRFSSLKRPRDGKYPWYRVLSGALGESGSTVSTWMSPAEDVPPPPRPVRRQGATRLRHTGPGPYFGPPVRGAEEQDEARGVRRDGLRGDPDLRRPRGGVLERLPPEESGGVGRPSGIRPYNRPAWTPRNWTLSWVSRRRRREGEWRYYDPRGGFDLLALLVNERLFVTRLRYEKSLFE